MIGFTFSCSNIYGSVLALQQWQLMHLLSSSSLLKSWSIPEKFWDRWEFWHQLLINQAIKARTLSGKPEYGVQYCKVYCTVHLIIESMPYAIALNWLWLHLQYCTGTVSRSAFTNLQFFWIFAYSVFAVLVIVYATYSNTTVCTVVLYCTTNITLLNSTVLGTVQ